VIFHCKQLFCWNLHRYEDLTSMNEIVRCNYCNKTTQLQVVRAVHPLLWAEKICSPGKAVSFDAYINSKVEIYSCQGATILQEETILAVKLAESMAANEIS
jgi:Domain of unknown function (DUF1830)